MAWPEKKPKPKTLRKPKVRYRVRGHHLHWIRGALMMKWRRDVPPQEFCDILGITPRLYQYILRGERSGGKKTLNGILALREYDLIFHLRDFAEEVPIREVRQTSSPSQSRRPHHRAGDYPDPPV